MFRLLNKTGAVRTQVIRRPDDSVRVRIMVSGGGGAVAFAENEEGLADRVLEVLKGPRTG